MRPTTIHPFLVALLLCAAPLGALADDPEQALPRRSAGETAPVLRAIDRLIEAEGVHLHAFRLDGDIRLQVAGDPSSLTAFRRALEANETVLAYLARDAVESKLVHGGRNFAYIQLSAADGSTSAPPTEACKTTLVALRRIYELARQAKLTVNSDLWKKSTEELPDGGRATRFTIGVTGWGAAERDFADLVAKDPLLQAVGAVERDARATRPHAIAEEPSITILCRLAAR